MGGGEADPRASEEIKRGGDCVECSTSVAREVEDGGRPELAAFVCPITCDVMNEPVVAADGNSYEASVILQWLKTRDTSPLTNEPLPHNEVVPNIALRHAIDEWRALIDCTESSVNEMRQRLMLKESEYEQVSAIKTREFEALLENHQRIISLNQDLTDELHHTRAELQRCRDSASTAAWWKVACIVMTALMLLVWQVGGQSRRKSDLPFEREHQPKPLLSAPSTSVAAVIFSSILVLVVMALMHERKLTAQA
jgi:hypothetical protein